MWRVVVKLLCCGPVHAMQWGPQELWGLVGDRLSVGTWCTSMSEHVKPGGRHCSPGCSALHTWGCPGFSSIPSAFSGALLDSHTARICLWLKSRFVRCQLRTWSWLLGGGWDGVCHHPLGLSISQMMGGLYREFGLCWWCSFLPQGQKCLPRPVLQMRCWIGPPCLTEKQWIIK